MAVQYLFLLQIPVTLSYVFSSLNFHGILSCKKIFLVHQEVTYSKMISFCSSPRGLWPILIYSLCLFSDRKHNIYMRVHTHTHICMVVLVLFNSYFSLPFQQQKTQCIHAHIYINICVCVYVWLFCFYLILVSCG